MENKAYEERKRHALQFLIDDSGNDDWVQSLLNYREQIEEMTLMPIITIISANNPNFTWTKGLLPIQIVAEFSTLMEFNRNACRKVDELEARVNELETMVKIQNGE